MKVCEIYKSIQGEGRYIGITSIFLRLGGCNLNCKYCDTKYSWKNYRDIEIKEVIEKLEKYEAKALSITGGEPLLQIEECVELIKHISKTYQLIIIETNGTLTNEIEYISYFNVVLSISVKTTNFIGHEYDYSELYKLLPKIKNTEKYIKLVVTDKDDISLIKYTISEILKNDSTIEIFLQPARIPKLNYINLIKKLWVDVTNDDYLSKTVRLLPQFHTLIFGSKRRV